MRRILESEEIGPLMLGREMIRTTFPADGP